MEDRQIPYFAGFHYSETKQDVLDASGNPTGLRRQSADVFCHLAKNHHRVVNRAELEESIWAGITVTDDSLSKCVSEIRKVLGDDSRSVLKTFPKRGYQLCADEYRPALGKTQKIKRKSGKYHRIVYLTGFITLVLIGFSLLSQLTEQTSSTLPADNIASYGVPHISVHMAENTESKALTRALVAETRASLDRYQTVLQTTQGADLLLNLNHHSASQSFVAELIEVSSGEILFVESYPGTNDLSAKSVARRITAAIASPGVGIVDKFLLERSRLVPATELDPASCYAHAFGCAKCSGIEDSITRRAEACLASRLTTNPEDARAWALQATIYAHQYWWANTLPEPMRSDPSLRQHLPQKAIEAAHKAESLSPGGDTGVYWGMAEAYFAACDADKLQHAIDRGLAINPDDPNLLGAFGNWLAYSGKWEEGAAMALRALEIEPIHYRKWWWMGPAKAAYIKGNYELAYEYFLKSYDERNWMSHLHQAYTLPYLDRLEDARKSASTLQDIYPGFTRERAIEIYDLLCFPDDFLRRMDHALELAGLPSRGSSDDLTNIILPRAKILEIDGLDVEFLDVGVGEVVLFVHGAFNDYRTWGHYMVPISERHRYVSYSRRYFGTQEWQDQGEHFTVETFAQDLIDLVEALELDGVHVVTWSSGIRTAIAAGVMRPDLFKSMVHYEPVEGHVTQGMPDEAAVNELAANWNKGYGPIAKSAFGGDEDRAVQLFYELVFETEPGGYESERELLREVTRQNGRTVGLNLSRYSEDAIKLTCDYVSQVSVPTLVIAGEKTHDYWQIMARRFADCLPNARFATLAGSNHYGPIEKIDEFSEMVLQFVDKHD